MRSDLVDTIQMLRSKLAEIKGIVNQDWIGSDSTIAKYKIGRIAEVLDSIDSAYLENVDEPLVKCSLSSECLADRANCLSCTANLYGSGTYRFMPYVPTCPRGYDDCVNDPAYIKYNYPDWYKDLYGDLTPEEASKQSCAKRIEEDPDEKYYCYDDEDK